MSSLNSTPDSNLIQLLVEGRSLSEKTLRETGVDIALLEECFKIMKPQLQYLGHYQPLQEHFFLPHWKAYNEHVRSSETGEELCLRVRSGGQAHRGQAASLYIPPTFVHLFLTKSNWWVLVAKDSPRRADQVITKLFESVRELCEYLDELQVENNRGQKVPYAQYSPAIKVARILGAMAHDRIEERESRLDSMRSMVREMDTVTNRVTGKQPL